MPTTNRFKCRDLEKKNSLHQGWQENLLKTVIPEQKFFWGRKNCLLKELREIFLAGRTSGVKEWRRD